MVKLKSLFSKYVLGKSSFLIGSMVFSNLINLIFNAYLGRTLSFAHFGLIALVNTFLYIISIGLGALASTINHRVAFITARSGINAGVTFYKQMSRKFTKYAIAFTLLWSASMPLLLNYFHIDTYLPLIIFIPVILLGVYASIAKGFIHGRFLFTWTAAFFLTESLSKLAFAYGAVTLGQPQLAYLAIPFSVLLASVISIIVASLVTRKQSASELSYSFLKSFFFASMVTGLTTNAFLTFDILLVKHYLSATQAGIYAFLALIGKMIFFFGSLFQTFMIPFVSRDEGAHRDPNKDFYVILMLTAGLTIAAFIAIGPLGSLILPYVFADKMQSITQYRTMYATGIALFTLANTFTVYHLIRHQYIFSVVAILTTIGMLIGIALNHATIGAIVDTIVFSSIFFLTINILMHILQRNGGFILANLLDLSELFMPLPKPNYTPFGKRILIFNWRDTQHLFAGGAEAYIHELGKRWVKSGNSVTLFCGNDQKHKRYEVIDGIRIIRRGGFYTVYFWAFLYYAFRLRGKFDIIIDCENGIPFFTPLYVKEKVFLLMHHVHQEVFRKSLAWPFSSFATFLEIKVMPYVYKRTQVITVSPSTKAEILAHKLTTIEPLIVYNGIDHNVYKPGKKSKTPLVVYLGRLKYYKTLNVFIKMAKELSKSNPNAEFVIAGEGEEGAKLKKLAISINAPVQFTGKISDEAKVHLLQNAWIVVNPSAMEGWGLTVIEANACGTPVVASDVPGLRDSVKDGETGYLIKHGRVDRFSDAVHKILKNSALRNRLGKNAKLWAKNFTWHTSAELSLKIMNQKILKQNTLRIHTVPEINI